jgi:hypothetical protein
MRIRCLMLGVLAMVVPMQLDAQETTAPQPPASTAPREHIVKKGDTLWDLAKLYLNDPFRWPLIFDANRKVVEDADLIYPDEVLVIPGLTQDIPLAPDATVVPVSTRSSFYPTEGNRVNAVVLGEGIYRPAVLPVQFHTAAWLQDTTGIVALGRVVRAVDPRSESQKLDRLAYPYERVYIAYGAGPHPQISDRLRIVRIGRDVEGWGHVVEPVAEVVVVEEAKDVFTAQVVSQYGKIEANALVLAKDSFPLHEGMEVGVVNEGPKGKIIAFLTDQPLPGLYDRGFVSLGRADGVAVGDEFDAYVPIRTSATRTGAVELPEERIARLRVIHVGEHTATFSIMELTHAVLQAGVPVRMVRALR